MINDIFMPALSSTMTEGKIVSWLKSPGDKVSKGETVLVVESDKADMDVESFYDGYLATILVEAGQEAPVGATIAFIAETEAEIEQAKQKATQETTNQVEVTEVITTENITENLIESVEEEAITPINTGRIIASPRAKKLAKELNIELSSLKGSGPNGRIVASDVQEATKVSITETVAKETIQEVITTPPVKENTPVATNTSITTTPKVVSESVSMSTNNQTTATDKIVPLTTLQQAVVRNMMASLQVPTFHVSYDITTNTLDKLYQRIKPKGVTMTALLAKAVAMTLQKHPIVNASYQDGNIKYNKDINIAVAVAMPDGGLITPVLKNADQIDIYSLARSWKDLVNRSRLKQLQPDEYNSGTFTISNLGMFGVSTFDAILPPGQGAILAIAGSKPQVVAKANSIIGIKNQMNVNITCDHRIIYGADAAGFLQDLAKLIETNILSLTL